MPPIQNKDYIKVHRWLAKNYGKANKCESPNCLRKTQVYHWAKLANRDYDKKRENFIMLCASCHKLYDYTDELRNKLSKLRMGVKNPFLAQLNKSRIGIPISEQAKRNMALSKVGTLNASAKLNDRQVSVMLYAKSFGASHKTICELFGISIGHFHNIWKGEKWTHINAPRRKEIAK